MEEHTKKRAAIQLVQKYGKKALPKTVEVAKFYLGERDEENAKRWISIGYEVKRILQIDNVAEVLSIENELLAGEEV